MKIIFMLALSFSFSAAAELSAENSEAFQCLQATHEFPKPIVDLMAKHSETNATYKTENGELKIEFQGEHLGRQGVFHLSSKSFSFVADGGPTYDLSQTKEGHQAALSVLENDVGFFFLNVVAIQGYRRTVEAHTAAMAEKLRASCNKPSIRKAENTGSFDVFVMALLRKPTDALILNAVPAPKTTP